MVKDDLLQGRGCGRYIADDGAGGAPVSAKDELGTEEGVVYDGCE